MNSANTGTKNLISVINKVFNVCTDMGVDKLVFDFPQIAVIGSQSAGKSSVLDSLVGK